MSCSMYSSYPKKFTCCQGDMTGSHGHILTVVAVGCLFVTSAHQKSLSRSAGVSLRRVPVCLPLFSTIHCHHFIKKTRQAAFAINKSHFTPAQTAYSPGEWLVLVTS